MSEARKTDKISDARRQMSDTKGERNGKKYNPSEIEKKWQDRWEELGIYEPDVANAKRPFYNLMMFPYPSAEGLHVGGIFTFGGVDAYGRFKRMQGHDVFEPIGLDGFGINAENHAIKTESHPLEHAKRTEDNFYRQLHATGISYAWNHKLETYDPHYYKWTQWLFTELFKAGLAYRKAAKVNFCPWCKTVLADEQVIDGKCERCSSVVEKKNLEQWFFRITKYADRLLANIEKLDWTEKVKVAQRNWIGKSAGAEIVWKLCDKSGQEIPGEIVTFTTRKDTIPGVTFLVLAPESEYVAMVTTSEQQKAVATYLSQVKDIPAEERQKTKVKSGVFTGTYAKNPFSGALVPVYVADYVLGGYGTGAVMGMPGHDTRDREFAAVFDLACIFTTKVPETVGENEVYKGSGEQINTGEGFDGLSNKEAGAKIFRNLEERGFARVSTQYHLRDWLISRQRYWGPPIPMIYCEHCAKKGQSWFDSAEAKRNQESGITNQDDFLDWDVAGWYPVEEKDLPVKLPYIEDYKPLGTGQSPLANDPAFVKVACPVCGNTARRETDVSDTFLDSSWYFFRYISADRDDVAFDKELIKKWLPVNMYIGGAEHSVLHLLYSRFVTMVLCDLGYIKFEEPFARFYAHGLIIKDGAKMSKSKGNVINPDEYVQKFGADTLRTYLLFLGPFHEGGDFRDTGIEGMNRFLKKVWRLFSDVRHQMSDKEFQMPQDREKMRHEIIKGMTEDMEGLRFNTAISKLMIYYNFLVKQDGMHREEVETYLQLLAPFAPHMAEELWDQLGFGFQTCLPADKVPDVREKGTISGSVHTSDWPKFDPKLLVSEKIEIIVQVNGKVRETVRCQTSDVRHQEKVEEMARKRENVSKFLEGKEVVKVIYVPGKVLNFVVR
jgi:leucyl-tRNA synthetase